MSAGHDATVREAIPEYEFAVETRGRWTLVRRRFFRHRLAAASLFVFAVVAVAGLLSHRLAPYGYEQVNIHALSAEPSWGHPFGTDSVGRDYFSRVLVGLGTDVRVALLVGVLGTLIGVILGATAGYVGGVFDNLLMRGIDLLLTMPPLIVLVVGAAYLNATTLLKVSVLISCVAWTPVARMVRASCLSLREREYVEAARAMGASDVRIVRRHILPNVGGTVAVAATIMIAGAVILETTLAFLGFGITNRISGDSRRSLGEVMQVANGEGLFNWWGLLFPGLAVVVLVAPIYFIGDGLRDAFDPTERRYGTPPRRRRRSRLRTRLAAALPHPDLSFELPFDVGAPWRAATSAASRVLEPWASHRERRAVQQAGPWRVVREAAIIVILIAGAAVGVYIWQVNPVHSSWALAGTDVQNVSRDRGVQSEISVAAAPATPSVLFAASNDSLLRTIRIYGSTNGGRNWTSGAGPSLGSSACARSDPAVAIAPTGREYVAFTVNNFCTNNDPTPYLVVASRAGPGRRWTVQRVARRASEITFDDRPSLAVAADGRVYIAWSRLLSWTYETIVVSSSRDGGKTWSPPRPVSRVLRFPQLVSLTTGPRGSVYLAGVDAKLGIWLATSSDEGRHLRLRAVSALHTNVASSCILAGDHPLPQQANRCLGPNPTVVASRQRVYVVWGTTFDEPVKDVSIATFDASGQAIARGVVRPADGAKADQFWPSATVDPRTGRLWVCSYDTSGDHSRKQSWFTCTSSLDGRTWSRPVRAGKSSASPEVLWEDARIYGFGDELGYGGYTGVAVSNGVAHAMWIDTRGVDGGGEEIFTARIAPQPLAR